MIVKRMRFDEKMKFNKIFINNGDGTFSIRLTNGSLTGVNGAGHRHREIMRNFSKAIQNNALRKAV